MSIKVLYEDKHVIVVSKPANMPTQSDPTGDLDLVNAVKNQLELTSSNKKVYLGLHHRLDRPVGGCILFTKTREINKSIGQQIQKHSIRKTYLCVVCGHPNEDNAELTHYLKKLKTVNMSKSVSKDTKDSKEAILEYECLAKTMDPELGPLSLLKVKLKTGRHHQIRVQLSAEELPILGDRKYNTNKLHQSYCDLSLWSSELSFYHFFNKKIIRVNSTPNLEVFPWNNFKNSLK